ncbi:MAG: tyrosine-type recombinase/integrase [Spirochaetales bacterium]|nr:tyrosine-type recombinase/integrase [Spirochaetales bacterium]
MTNAPFTLCRIKGTERFFYYALFRDPATGKRGNKKSVEVLKKALGEHDGNPVTRRDEAVRICQRALQQGLVFSKPSNVTLHGYLADFYDWSKSEYVKRRNLLQPGSLSRDYIHIRNNMMNNHVLPIVDKDVLLSEVTLNDIERIQLSLVEKGNVSYSTINIIMSAIGVALGEAQRRELLDRTRTVTAEPLHVVHRRRGILTEDELVRFMAYAKEHSEKRIHLAILLSLLTGMRSGELRALQRSSLGRDSITVERAYADHAGLKLPKGKRIRLVPCPASLIEDLHVLAESNPYEGGHDLVFWSKRGGGFVSSHYFSSRFKEELVKSGVFTAEDLKKRNITFHSLRHMANTLLRGHVDEHVLRLTIGHTSQRLSDLYTHMNRRTLQAVALAQEKTILSLLEDRDPEGPNDDSSDDILRKGLS